MQRNILFGIGIIVVVLVSSLCAMASAQFYAGYAQEDLTPTQAQLDQGDIYLGGYGIWKFRGPGNGVHDQIWARSTAISVNDTVMTMTILDAIGISNRILNSIRTAVSAQTGISVNNIMISATHTHAAPDLQGLWGFIPDDYRQSVIDKVTVSIVNAYRNRVPARLHVSFGVGFANNRRDWGYTDTDMIVLDMLDMNNQRITTLINFAAHPVLLDDDNLLVSSDYCHYIREFVEDALGAPVSYFSGATGDVSPQGGGYEDDYDACRWYGQELGAIALESMSEQLEVTPSIKIDTQNFTHKISNPAFLLAFAVGMLDYDKNEDNSIDTRASYFRLGNEIQGVCFPGESLTRNALAIKEVMVTKHKLFLGLNSDALGYFVPSDEWRTGRNENYEENVSIHKMVGDNTRDLLVDMILRDDF